MSFYVTEGNNLKSQMFEKEKRPIESLALAYLFRNPL